jgi:hypothetical protein
VPAAPEGVIAYTVVVAFCPDAAGYLVGGHPSSEPGASRALAVLDPDLPQR